MIAKAGDDIAFLGLHSLKRFLIKLVQLVALGEQMVVEAVATGVIHEHNSKHTSVHRIEPCIHDKWN
jgi:hypothetical protein